MSTTTLPEHPDSVDSADAEWFDFAAHDRRPSPAVQAHRLKVIAWCRARLAARMNGDVRRARAPRRARGRARRPKPARASADDGEPPPPPGETPSVRSRPVIGACVDGDSGSDTSSEIYSGGATPKGGGSDARPVGDAS